MRIHELKRNTANKKAKRVGRGGSRGKTSGRGHKGQKARAGGSPRPEIRDIIKRIPKRRGYGKNRARSAANSKKLYDVVNVGSLERVFSEGSEITPLTLSKAGLVHGRAKIYEGVKVLGTGPLTKKLTFKDVVVSKTAREKIEKAGGSIIS